MRCETSCRTAARPEDLERRIDSVDRLNPKTPLETLLDWEIQSKSCNLSTVFNILGRTRCSGLLGGLTGARAVWQMKDIWYPIMSDLRKTHFSPWKTSTSVKDKNVWMKDKTLQWKTLLLKDHKLTHWENYINMKDLLRAQNHYPLLQWKTYSDDSAFKVQSGRKTKYPKCTKNPRWRTCLTSQLLWKTFSPKPISNMKDFFLKNIVKDCPSANVVKDSLLFYSDCHLPPLWCSRSSSFVQIFFFNLGSNQSQHFPEQLRARGGCGLGRTEA